jgi:hypothetical protein
MVRSFCLTLFAFAGHGKGNRYGLSPIFDNLAGLPAFADPRVEIAVLEMVHFLPHDVFMGRRVVA